LLEVATVCLKLQRFAKKSPHNPILLKVATIRPPCRNEFDDTSATAQTEV
jgi:hypothetical protein